MPAESTVVTLRDVALFRQLSDVELEGLSRQLVRRHYGRNELVFSQGESGDGLYVVTEGHASINRQSPDGDELILAVYEPGEYFGELALFDEEPRSASAAAIDDCSLLFLSRIGFRDFLKLHPSAIFTCLAVIVRQLRRLTDIADELALMDVRTRLARRLVRLAEQGVVGTGNEARDAEHGAFPITQQHLANMMGATRESVNKHLNSFVDEGVIRLERGHIEVLDLKRMQAVSDGFG